MSLLTALDVTTGFDWGKHPHIGTYQVELLVSLSMINVSMFFVSSNGFDIMKLDMFPVSGGRLVPSKREDLKRGPS